MSGAEKITELVIIDNKIFGIRDLFNKKIA